MPAAHVRCDHDIMKALSGDFDKAQGDAEKMLQTLAKHKETLCGGAWIGEGSRAYCQEHEDMVKPEFTRLANALGEASKAMKDISQIFQDAEDEASALLHV